MRKMLLQLAIAIFILLPLGSCSSFPKPNRESDTLLIIPTNFIKYTSPYLFGRYHAKLVNIKKPAITRDLPIEPTMRYQIVQGLPEGDYIIPEYNFVYDIRPKDSKPIKSSVTFSLQRGRVTILEDIFEYMQRGDGHTFYYSGRWRRITVDELSYLYEDISQKGNFTTWQLSDNTNDLIDIIKNPQDQSIHPLNLDQ